MDITFWVTQDCNLDCKYCYNRVSNNLKKEYMTNNVAENALRLLAGIKGWKDSETIYINFHGGEPLMNTNAIEFVMHELDKYKEDKNIVYGMTTNGTIYGKKQKEILLKIDNLSISLDGQKNIHDKNRLFKNGQGSFHTVMNNAIEIKGYKDFRLRITVTKDTIGKLYETIVFLISKGFKNIVPVLDMYDSNWYGVSEEEIIAQFREIKKYISDNNIVDADIGWISSHELTPKGSCDGGITNFHILPNGEIYPCSMVVGDDEWIIGNVMDGLDQSKIDKIQQLNKIPTKSCAGCNMYPYCPGSRCKLLNKKISGDFLTASSITCIESRLNLELKN